MSQMTIGVIGGSGLYEIEGLTDIEEVRLDTPFGEPSDLYITGLLEGVKMVFLPRHGRGEGKPNEFSIAQKPTTNRAREKHVDRRCRKGHIQQGHRTAHRKLDH